MALNREGQNVSIVLFLLIQRNFTFFSSKEKEIYRWPARESLKTMLALGWSLERTKEGGEAIRHQRENEKLRSISQSSQVRYKALSLQNKRPVQ